MTGPDHYAEAERLPENPYDSRTSAPQPDLVARAQVHAVLALAAAIGVSADVVDAREWRKAAGLASVPSRRRSRFTRTGVR
jgi:hypothetical protein